MILSLLKVSFNINTPDIQIFEDDSGLELEELEDGVLNLREEALKRAIWLKDIYALLRKGGSTK